MGAHGLGWRESSLIWSSYSLSLYMGGIRKHLFVESFSYSRYIFWGKAKPVEFAMGGTWSSPESASMKVPKVEEIESTFMGEIDCAEC